MPAHHHQHHQATTTFAAPQQQLINVYTSGFKTALKIHPSAVAHLPSVNPAYYVLCSNYDAANPKSPNSCRMGDSCKFVHADTSSAREHTVHVNFAWQSLESCTYERFPAGKEMHVATPNCNVVVDVMDSCFVLKTKALQGATKLTHCAHYYFNRTCNLGPDCHFVHAVYVDPTAVPGQRAPVPSQMGDGREAQLSKRQREAAAASSVAATPRRAPFVTHATPQQQRFAAAAAPVVPKAVAAPVAPAPAPAPAVVATPVSTPKAAVEGSAKPTAAAAARLPRSPSSSSCPSESSTSTHRHSYRYDPYSKTQPMLVLCCA